ncbi:MAG: D-glycero-beta-D-manno-heptose 1-phosphate adenylyltransferase [Bacteroidales bacterium]|nr:D-glycero-beta-D-manno-heptose 1-phosphate adenylyltransferase [Bacteroidales bacterium]
MQHLLNMQSKIFPQANDDLGRLVAYWNFKNQKIVFTNGCFDILHRGHIDYLAKAADLGNVLVVGLNADASVSRLKGAGRPVQDQDGRALVLAALRFVSAVVLFDEDTPYQLIKAVQPDVLVKGSDYKTDDIVGADIVKAKGGSVQTIDFLEGYSTSGIIRRLLASSKDK